MSDFLSFRLPEDFIASYSRRKVDWGFQIGGGNSLSELTFISKYSRLKEDGSKERWYEVCRRCVEGTYSILKDHAKYHGTPWNEFKAQKSAEDAYDRMFHFKWTPPGRGLQHAGTEYIFNSRNSARLINCAALSTEKLSTHSAYEATMPFMRLMEMSMNGIGVGIDTRGAGNITLHQPSPETETYVIEDTREAWAESLGALLETFFFKNRKSIEFDYSQIRPEGAPLKSFGGSASGPEPLRRMHEKIAQLLSKREGELLSSRDIVDIANLSGKAAVAGGARRSALIAFGYQDDEDFVNLKNWELEENSERTGPDGWAWASNNSVLAEVGEDLSSIVDKIAINGEPGILWVDAMQRYGRMVDAPNNKDYRANVTNPCVTGDTWVLTPAGPRQVSDLVDVRHSVIVDGKTYPASGFWSTGQKEVYRLVLSDGRELRLTGNHRLLNANGDWVELVDLAVGDQLRLNRHEDISWAGVGTEEEGYLLGHLIGDGTFAGNQAHLAVWEEDAGSDIVADYLAEIVGTFNHRSDWRGWFATANQRRLSTTALSDLAAKFGVVRGHKTITAAIEQASSDMSMGVLRGLFDTDGSVQGTQTKGVSVRLSNTDYDLLRAAQRMLLRLGINSKIYSRRDAGMRKLPDGHGGLREYYCNADFDLVVSKANLSVFADRIGFMNPVKQGKLEDSLAAYVRNLNKEDFLTEIASIEMDGVEEVFDVTVEDIHTYDANGLMSHNCGEIALEGGGELCNLSEVYPTNHDSLADFKKSIKHAYMYSKAVTLLTTPWAETNEIIIRNRRIGISMTGVAQFVETRGWSEMREWMDSGYQHLSGLDKSYSEWLGVRESIKVSTIKPAGSTSLIAGVTPGVHWPTTSNYHIRRVRYRRSDPILDLLREAGYEVEPDVNDPETTVVASFPTKGVDIRSEREVSLWEKGHLAALAQKYWSDNLVSCTLSFRESERDQLVPLMSSLDGQLKSASFLPIDESGTSYAQAPYEPIAEEDAVKWMESVSKIDKKHLYRQGLEFVEEKFCTADTCEISFG